MVAEGGLELARAQFDDTIQAFQEANMNIRGWCSNSSEALQQIPEEIPFAKPPREEITNTEIKNDMLNKDQLSVNSDSSDVEQINVQCVSEFHEQ